MGRSRGGLTTKIHALVDAMGLPIFLKLTEGQAHDGRSAEDMFDTVRTGTGLLADRAYDSNALRLSSGNSNLPLKESTSIKLGGLSSFSRNTPHVVIAEKSAVSFFMKAVS